MRRTLDYVARLDERNRAHRLAAAEVDLTKRSRFWVPGQPVLDQGEEGACVGFGVTGEAMASPARWKPISTAQRFSGNEVAFHVYRKAKEVDEWEGVDYEGTSVRAGMLVGRDYGWWTGFRWAFNMTELRAGLEEGPVVAGVEWREGMYEPKGDKLLVTGDVVGGHCILITGYKAFSKSYRVRNSWGREWGVRGTAYIATADLDRILFQAGGEAAVAIGRAA